MDLAQVLPLCFSCSKEMNQMLVRGYSFEQVLRHFLPKGSLFGSLLGLLPLAKALECFKKLEAGSKDLLKKIGMKSLYPLFLMAFSTVLIWLFATMIMPSMSEWADEQTKGMMLVLELLAAAFWLILFLALLAFSIMKLLHKESWILKAGSSLPFVKKLASLQFGTVLACLLENGISLQDGLEFLSEQKSFFFACTMAKSWQKKLQAGRCLEDIIKTDPLLDPLFVHFARIGLESGTMASMLHGACSLLERKVSQQTDRLCQGMCALAYGFVGLLAVSLYQTMLAPMNMLSGL